MGTHMQCQAVPLLVPRSRLSEPEWNLQFSNHGAVIRAKDDGVVTYADGSKVVFEKKGGQTDIFRNEIFPFRAINLL